METSNQLKDKYSNYCKTIDKPLPYTEWLENRLTTSEKPDYFIYIEKGNHLGYSYDYTRFKDVAKQEGLTAVYLHPANGIKDWYTLELEGLLCFIAGCYEKAKETYFDKHMETCSVSNLSRRELTDAEQSEWQRFPMVQGTVLQNAVSKISVSKKTAPIDLKRFMDRFNDSIPDACIHNKVTEADDDKLRDFLLNFFDDWKKCKPGDESGTFFQKGMNNLRVLLSNNHETKPQ